MSQSEEDLNKVQQMMRDARPAEGDTEQMLLDLDMLARRRRPDPYIEEQYEALRDVLTARLSKEGPRYFIDVDGEKRYAYAVVPEPIEVDVDEVIALHDEGEISTELLDRIAPRKIDAEQFKLAVARGSNPNSRKPGITQEQLLRVARKRRGTGHVRFASPGGREED